jgi:hypothetical protein
MKHEFNEQTNRQIVPPSYAFTIVRANNILPWLRLLVCHSEDLGSIPGQSMCDLWRIKFHQGKISQTTSTFSASIIPAVSHNRALLYHQYHKIVAIDIIIK